MLTFSSWQISDVFISDFEIYSDKSRNHLPLESSHSLSETATIETNECGTQNLAINKSTKQSSTYPSAPSSKAVDGNTNGAWSGGSIANTYNELNAWWELDLGGVYSLETINLWSRTNCCQDRLADFYVISSAAPFASQDLNATLNQPGVKIHHVDTTVVGAKVIHWDETGRYIRIQLAGTNLLHLAEVEVFGCALPGLQDSNCRNVALAKPASQSSLWNFNTYNFEASNATDGDRDGFDQNNTMTATLHEREAWWEVDLKESYPITGIKLWNRDARDCYCHDRLTDFYVISSDKPFISQDLSTTLSQAGVSWIRHQGTAGRETYLSWDHTARYVRVQLAGTNILSLAEVEVISRLDELAVDTDGDGVEDYVDLDDDNDGILDTVEACSLASFAAARELPAGIYNFNFGNGAFKAYTDGYGWILWLQYHHQGGTNPDLNVISAGENLPIYDASCLGTDNSSDLRRWGHGSQALAASIPDAQLTLRFQASTSAHDRVIDFETQSLGGFRTDGNTFGDMGLNFLPSTLHTANIPALANSFSRNQGDFTLTEFPFYTVGAEHWGIRGLGNRWEVDNSDANGSHHTIHRVWIKSSDSYTNMPMCDLDGDGILNDLDTDADGDGCPDAIEGSKNFGIAHLNEGRLMGKVDARGVPLLASPEGQGIGTSNLPSSQNSNCPACDPGKPVLTRK